MNRPIRLALLLSALFVSAYAVGFILQSVWATSSWPFDTSRLTSLFLGSMLAAVAAPLYWISLSGELRALAGGAINLALTNAGFLLVTLAAYSREGRPGLLAFAGMSLAVLILAAALFFFSRRLPFLDPRPLPGLARASFILFAAILLMFGGALVLQRPNVFPWPISPENSQMFGWIFLGSFAYFCYGLVFPRWANARGQLLSFLVYDLILIGPFLAHLPNVAPALRLSLSLYIGVLVFSALVALFFLFVHPRTRFGLRARQAAPLTPQP